MYDLCRVLEEYTVLDTRPYGLVRVRDRKTPRADVDAVWRIQPLCPDALGVVHTRRTHILGDALSPTTGGWYLVGQLFWTMITASRCLDRKMRLGLLLERLKNEPVWDTVYLLQYARPDPESFTGRAYAEAGVKIAVIVTVTVRTAGDRPRTETVPAWQNLIGANSNEDLRNCMDYDVQLQVQRQRTAVLEESWLSHNSLHGNYAARIDKLFHTCKCDSVSQLLCPKMFSCKVYRSWQRELPIPGLAELLKDAVDNAYGSAAYMRKHRGLY